jgi:hypothetical protein
MKFCAASATRRRDLVRKVRSGVNEATFADAYGSDCIAPLAVISPGHARAPGSDRADISRMTNDPILRSFAP